MYLVHKRLGSPKDQPLIAFFFFSFYLFFSHTIHPDYNLLSLQLPPVPLPSLSSISPQERGPSADPHRLWDCCSSLCKPP